jgi:hypothetical protein
MKTKITFFVLVLLALPRFGMAALSSDINSDTCTDASDISILKSVFRSNNTTADLDASGEVNLKDAAIIMHEWAPCANTVNISELLPYAPNTNLKYQFYNPDGSAGNTFEILRTEPWADGTHFTVHHYYGNVGSQASQCPRVDDVFGYNANNLFYTDTYNFYDPAVDEAGLTRTTYTEGHLWGQMTMFKDTEVLNTMTGKVFDLQHILCSATSSSERPSATTNQTKAIVSDATAWSPYTGGESNLKPVIMLQETTYLNSAPNDIFQEQWNFYDDPQYGYIPIEITILKQTPNDTSLQVISHERLQGIN